MLVLKEKITVLIRDVQQKQMKVDEKMLLLKSLNFLMQLSVEKFTEDEIKGTVVKFSCEVLFRENLKTRVCSREDKFIKMLNASSFDFQKKHTQQNVKTAQIAKYVQKTEN